MSPEAKRRAGDTRLELPGQPGSDGEWPQQDSGLGVVLLQPGLQFAHQRVDVAMVVQIDDELAVVRRERLGINRQVKPGRAGADEAGDPGDARIAQQLFLDAFQILGHRLDPCALRQAIVEQELRHGGVRKEQLRHLSETDERRDEQPHCRCQGEDAMANGAFKQRAESCD